MLLDHDLHCDEFNDFNMWSVGLNFDSKIFKKTLNTSGLDMFII